MKRLNLISPIRRPFFLCLPAGNLPCNRRAPCRGRTQANLSTPALFSVSISRQC
jgi:hypothetical protein